MLQLTYTPANSTGSGSYRSSIVSEYESFGASEIVCSKSDKSKPQRLDSELGKRRWRRRWRRNKQLGLLSKG